MITVEQARALVRECATPVAETERVALASALFRVLADPVHADRDDPPFARSLMDGYALRAGDGALTRRVIARIAAGDVALPTIESGTAAWINTGAPVPSGADTVVPVEQTRTDGDVMTPEESPAAGANILPQATFARAGDAVARGFLTPERIAVCAAQGADPVTVRRRPRVAVLATGTELAREPGAHDIRNSNGPLLRAMLARHDVIDLGTVDDDEQALRTALARGLDADALLTTGGVSMGDKDLVRPALEALGVEIVFHGVKLQPGKPVLFGTRDSAAVFALPGNPVSAMVCADLFALPYLAVRAGRAFEDALRADPAIATGPIKASRKRHRVFPCRRRGGEAEPLPWRGSGDLYVATGANAYMVIEQGVDIEKGDQVVCLVPERFSP